MRLLTICPSRNRPDKLARMLESFYNTRTSETQIVVYIGEEDPRLKEYEQVLKGVNHRVGPRKSLVEVLNFMAAEEYPGLSYYQEINDDHVYHTKTWDEALIGAIEAGGGWGISCANDLMTNEPWEVARHPSGAVISGNIVRVLDCFVYPGLDHLFTDTYLRDIAEGIGRYYHLTDVIIEHCHPISGKAERDEGYKLVYDHKAYNLAHRAFLQWLKLHKAKDIQKLKEAMDGGL